MKHFFEDKKREVTSIKDSIRLMQNKGYVFVRHNNDNKYDIEFKKDNKSVFVEVKQDFSCFRTGNVGVEYSCRGKPSGISVSKADFYIYKIHQNYLFTEQVNKIEPEKPNEITIILIDKKKLKNCIDQILNQVENKEKRIIDTRKNNFYIRKVIDNETKEEYEISVRLINGGDIGSNSLNILFDRHSFVKNFTYEYLETRKRTLEEERDLKATLENRKNREKIKYNR